MGDTRDIEARRVRRLGELAGVAGASVDRADASEWPVRGVAADAGRVRAGYLFVAVPGSRFDGHAFAAEAVARGAVAVVAERDLPGLPVPVLRVPDSRRALAEIAAEWHGRPASRLMLVGITGSLGKTSVLSMLEAILHEAGCEVATIGSLGVRHGDTIERMAHTTPGPLELHAALSALVDRGARLVAMEVTSHALDQSRVHGLTFDLGVFTGLVPLEHLEYHGTFRNYVLAKSRFFDHLACDAPVVYPAGDRLVRELIRRRPVVPVSCGRGGRVSLRVDRVSLNRDGSRAVLTNRHPLPVVGDGERTPGVLELELRVLGRPNVANAALAATAALCLGASEEAVRRSLASFPAPWRRMQIVHRGRFTVLDDTVGHPDSISAVFEVARSCGHRRLHVVYAIRGGRRPEINRRDAETVAIWARRVPLTTLLVTSSEDAVGEANRVAPAEREAFLDVLSRYGVPYEHHSRLWDAIGRVVEVVGDRDLVLLLGAQGMNRGAEWLMRQIEGGTGGPRRG